ncbi:MAG: nucleotidyl transferase AbiEii/AbiGii toxin family protein, partial [Bacteroidales bacterium]
GVFEDAIRAANDHLGIRTVFVEKDYWITYLLLRLSKSPHSDEIVFKGGTSLSKVHKMIDRFSENLDLAILRTEGRTATQVRNLIRKVEKELVKGFEEVNLEGITSKQTRYRKTAYDYKRAIASESVTGIQELMILEINSFANPVPFKRMAVSSLIEQFLFETNQHDTIEKFGLQPFELNVLVPESTLIEKVLSLIRLSFFEDRIDKLRTKVRHFYDLYFISISDACREYIHTAEFMEQFCRMFEEDKTKFDDPKAWLNSSYVDAPIVTSFNEIWNEVKVTYNTDFRLLVHGDFPEDEHIADQFRKIIQILLQ